MACSLHYKPWPDEKGKVMAIVRWFLLSMLLSTGAWATAFRCNDANPEPPMSSAELNDEGEDVRVRVFADYGSGWALRADFLAHRVAVSPDGFEYRSLDNLGTTSFLLSSTMTGYLARVTAPGLQCAGTP